MITMQMLLLTVFYVWVTGTLALMAIDILDRLKN
jgi:hypothetical protein